MGGHCADGARLSNAYPIVPLNLHSSSWDVAKTSAATARIPLRERLTYASLYAALENWRELLRNEVANTQTITALFETANQPENRRQIPALLSRATNFGAISPVKLCIHHQAFRGARRST